MIKHSMNKLFVLFICSMAVAGSLFAQVPTGTPIASPTVATAATAATAATSIAGLAPTATPAPSATSSSVSSDLADRIHRKLEKKLGHKHGIIIDVGDKDSDDVGSSKDIPAMVIPLVAIVFMTIFGAPVLIVMLIGV